MLNRSLLSLAYCALSLLCQARSFLLGSSRVVSKAPVNLQEKETQDEVHSFSSRPEDLERRDFLLGSLPFTLAALTSSVDCVENASATQILTETSAVSEGSSQKITSYDPDIPFSSFRSYKKIRLSNGLSVLLVSDKSAYRASAALTVNGAGQFADPKDLPGLAHLMEHMILSYNSKSTFRQSRDFEDWLGDNEGDSVFPEAVERFAGLFRQQDVEKICRDGETLKREVRRVDAELDFESASSQAFYLTKSFINMEHPYSRFSAGSLETLETNPRAAGIDVGERLIEFFRKYYQPDESVLVLIARQDFFALERIASLFGQALSREKRRGGGGIISRGVPGAFLIGNRNKNVVLLRQKDESKFEELSFQWTLNMSYQDKAAPLTATQVAFVVAQTVARKGSGGLYQFLQRRGWVPSDPSGLPRVSLPVEVPGFQVMKMTIKLTQEGVLNRAAVVNALYDCIESFRRGDSYFISRELIRQQASIAKLHAYVLAPRPPDAVELAMDAQLYGFQSAVGNGRWYRFPEERSDISALQRAMSDTFALIADPSNAVIILTAGMNMVAQMEAPLSSSALWLTEPVAGGRFYFEDMLKSTTRLEQLVLKSVVNRDELSLPVVNPLVPSSLRPPRIIQEVTASRSNVNELLLFPTAVEEANQGRVFRIASSRTIPKAEASRPWEILDPSYPGQRGLSIPRCPPESTCRCAFVLELTSSRPVRADVRQAARAELWKVSFEAAVKDLVEVGGVPGALAYEISFNNYGMRIATVGISQTLPSYTRRLARRLVEHAYELLKGPQYFSPVITSAAIFRAERSRWSSQQRKRAFISNLRTASAYEAATEGISFFQSCTGAVSFAQGDLLRTEVSDLTRDLQSILEPSFSTSSSAAIDATRAATPGIEDLLYKPMWKTGFSCAVIGMSLLSDGCGRVPR